MAMDAIEKHIVTQKLYLLFYGILTLGFFGGATYFSWTADDGWLFVIFTVALFSAFRLGRSVTALVAINAMKECDL